MKNNLLKVCALVLCAVTVVTGCQKNEGENVVKEDKKVVYN